MVKIINPRKIIDRKRLAGAIEKVIADAPAGEDEQETRLKVLAIFKGVLAAPPGYPIVCGFGLLT